MKTLDAVPMLDVFLNYACQAKCPFCYNPPLTDALIRWKLSVEALGRRLIEGRDKGFTGVTFSGGEVTLLAELPKMVALARKAGYSEIGIISNGIRLAEEAYLRGLKDLGLTFACVSIHSASPALHDEILAVPGAFEKAERALAGLAALGLPFALNFVMTRKNHAQAPAFVERHARRPGLGEIQLYFPHYEGLMVEHAEALKVPIKDALPSAAAALAKARELGADGKVFVYNAPPCALPGLPLARLRNWEREEHSLLVDPQGAETGEFQSERRGRFKDARCRSCALDGRCLGFEAGYAARFGSAELSPL